MQQTSQMYIRLMLEFISYSRKAVELRFKIVETFNGVSSINFMKLNEGLLNIVRMLLKNKCIVYTKNGENLREYVNCVIPTKETKLIQKELDYVVTLTKKVRLVAQENQRIKIAPKSFH